MIFDEIIKNPTPENVEKIDLTAKDELGKTMLWCLVDDLFTLQDVKVVDALLKRAWTE